MKYLIILFFMSSCMFTEKYRAFKKKIVTSPELVKLCDVENNVICYQAGEGVLNPISCVRMIKLIECD